MDLLESQRSSLSLSLYYQVRYLGWTRARLCLHADGRRFDPHIRQNTFVEICHHSEMISTVMYFFLLWRLVMKRFLRSCTGERMCTKAWWLPRNLWCGYNNSPHPKLPQKCRRAIKLQCNINKNNFLSD